MLELISIGLIGGLVTGISPCILPVLPIVLAVTGDGRRRPWLVALGIAVSFTAITLLGATVLAALGLPRDTIRWVGVALLVAVGIGMIIPRIGDWLEAPFARIRMPQFVQERSQRAGSGFGVGLALGAIYVPCAGPVLAAVTVAGATGEIGWGTLALAVSFATGACTPLFFFALAGSRLAGRARLVRKHRVGMSRAAGALVLCLAIAIAADAPQALQRALPDWTSGVQESLTADSGVREALARAQGESNPAGSAGSGSLGGCRQQAGAVLRDCGEVPAFAGLTDWFNTDTPVDPANPARIGGRQSVTLVDFWAYACINCQRAGTHLTALYDRYRDYGLQVVGVHAPEYAFEHEPANVRQAAADAGIHYPVALDNEFRTWNAFGNRYWPAHYLVDAAGRVRQVHEGEGGYAETEQLVRQLLEQANPGIVLPELVEAGGDGAGAGAGDGAGGGAGAGTGAGAAIATDRNPETYLGTDRAEYVSGAVGAYRSGRHDFPDVQPERGHFALVGPWQLEAQSISPAGPGARIRLDYRAARVQLVASGSGTLQVRDGDGAQRAVPVRRAGTIDLVRESASRDGLLDIEVPAGVQLYSFTFG